jgi:hypothetical protein
LPVALPAYEVETALEQGFQLARRLDDDAKSQGGIPSGRRIGRRRWGGSESERQRGQANEQRPVPRATGLRLRAARGAVIVKSLAKSVEYNPGLSRYRYFPRLDRRPPR